jgi:hypothetical protein
MSATEETPAADAPPAAPRRRWRWWLGLGVGAPLGLALSIMLFWHLYDPRVPLAPPLVIERTAPEPGQDVTVVIGGDFAPTDAAMPFVRRHGWRYPYLGTAAILRDADVSFLNLEAPVTADAPELPRYTTYKYRVWPAALEAWTFMGLDLVNLANNHMKDRSDAGLKDTLRHLDDAGIAHVGAGLDETAARRPVIADVGGTRIGFLGYLEDDLFNNLYLRAFAVGQRIGCARYGRKDVAEDVRRLRPLVDVLVVSVHWGKNYAGTTRFQRREGRWLLAQGVDVVAGHHAHDVQPVEVHGRRVILYSVGNYAWGGIGRGHLRVGLLARLRITPRQGSRPARLGAVELLPIATQNRIVHFQPRPLRTGERRWLDPLIEGSRALGTELRWNEGLLNVRLEGEP